MAAADKGHVDRAHAPYAPSGSNRWLNCTAQVPFVQQLLASGQITPKGQTRYTLDGTACHEKAEEHLLAGTDPAEDFTDATVELTMEEALALNDGDMHWRVPAAQWQPHVIHYVAVIREIEDDLVLLYGRENVQVIVEAKVSIKGKDCWGSVDCAIVVKGQELHVIDLKAGSGKLVQVFENPQFMTYAAGLAKKYKYDFHTCVLHCVQAANETAPHSTWDCSMDDLRAHIKRVNKAINDSKKPALQQFNTTDCAWCEAEPVCPEKVRMAAAVFDDVDTEVGVPAKVEAEVLPAPAQVPDGKLAWFLVRQKQITSWLDSLAAHAKERLLRGEELPGVKLVAGRSTRKYDPARDEATIAAAISELGADPYQKTLRAFSKVEKELGKGALDHLLVKTEGAPRLVPEDAKGEPITLASSFDDAL